MTLRELLERLEGMEQAAGDVEVRVAYQPNYPLVANVSEVTLETESSAAGRPGDVVWIALSSGVYGNEHPYAPGEAWDGGDFCQRQRVTED